MNDDVLHPPLRALSLLEQAVKEDRLDLAALAVAATEHPEVSQEACLGMLDAYAGRVRALLSAHSSLHDQVTALKRVLADEEGFRGNSERYHAPENSFLNRVLERKLGLPIALSVLYLEVARRAGIALYGVNFPGHFLIAGGEVPHGLVVDPFHCGNVLTYDGCADLLKEMAPQMVFKPEMITPASVKTITTRMLANLKRVYLEANDHARAFKVVTLLLKLTPDHPGELRVRASVLCSIGAFKAALRDVCKCLELSPGAPDREGLELARKALEERVDRLN